MAFASADTIRLVCQVFYSWARNRNVICSYIVLLGPHLIPIFFSCYMVVEVPLNVTPLQESATNYLFVASVAIICYDHALTFEREIRFIWRRPWHVLPLTFIFVRYFALIFNVIRMVLLFRGVTPTECHAFTLVRNIFLILVMFTIWASQIWRVSALYNYEKRFLLKVAVFFLVLVGLVLWELPTEKYMFDEYILGCPRLESQISLDYAQYIWIIYAIWEGVITILTIRKTWKSARYSSGVYGRQFLSTLMLRDGVIYFLIVNAFNLASIVTFFTKSRFLMRNSFSWISICASITMNSRFILNLRENPYMDCPDDDDGCTASETVISEIIFQQLGNLHEESGII